MYTMRAIANLCCILFIGYIAGSLPTSIIVSKIVKGIDIRNYGSGNAGATNTFRVLGWKAGLIVACIDVFKGFAVTFWVSRLNLFNAVIDVDMLVPIMAGGAAVLGHCYTLFADFKGGKGVAASAGMLIALFPTAFLICFGVFTAVLFLSGYVSLSSILAAIALPVTLIIIRLLLIRPVSAILMVFSISICAFILYSHRANIARLIRGTENRFKMDKLLIKR